MRRRLEGPGTFNYWPAFTDVLGGLVVVLIFLITIFVIGEVLIGREMTGKDTAIGQLQRIINHLEILTGESEQEVKRLQQRVSRLEATVAERETQLNQSQRELAASQQAQAELIREKAQAEQDRALLEEDAALLSARAERLAEELERLNRALIGSEGQLATTQAELAQREAVIAEQQGQIEAMDKLIKQRLVDRVEELENYASDFFGRLREVFADNPDIRIVGDRFVFQSEVLFASGEATLSPAGRTDLDKFIGVYRQVAERLPKDLPVIIQVQGHTDRVPIRTARFRSNWELSIQRALDVVNYLIEQGIPPQRLAAVGMGEYHPIDPANTHEAYRRNRRIELKITSR